MGGGASHKVSSDNSLFLPWLYKNVLLVSQLYVLNIFSWCLGYVTLTSEPFRSSSWKLINFSSETVYLTINYVYIFNHSLY